MTWFRASHHNTPTSLFTSISKNPDAAFFRFHDFYERLFPYFLEKYPENLDRRHLDAIQERLVELEAYIRYAMACTRFREEDLHTDFYEPLRHLYTCVQETFKHIDELIHLQKELGKLTWYDHHDGKRHMKTHNGHKPLADKELEQASLVCNAFTTILLHLEQEKDMIRKGVDDYEHFRREHNVHHHMNTTSLEQLNYHSVAL